MWEALRLALKISPQSSCHCTYYDCVIYKKSLQLEMRSFTGKNCCTCRNFVKPHTTLFETFYVFCCTICFLAPELIFSCFTSSLHRYKRADVSAQQQRAPLSKLARPLLQLHLRGRQPGADLAPGAQPGPQLPQGHPGGHRLRPHLPRGCQEDHPAQPPDHQRSNLVQTNSSGG